MTPLKQQTSTDTSFNKKSDNTNQQIAEMSIAASFYPPFAR